MSYVQLTEDEIAKLTKINRYSTLKEDHYFDELYCDPQKKLFYKRTWGHEFKVGKPHKWNQAIKVIDIKGNPVKISFGALIRVYPELRPLYDFDWKPPIRIHIEAGELEISMDSSLDSSIVSSFMEDEIL